MLEALIMTLGFEPGPLVSAVAARASEGLGKNAKIIVLTPSFKDERAERAWRQLQDVFSMMRLRDSGVKLYRLIVDLEDFTSAVLKIKNLFSELRDKTVSISLTGGMRALILAVFVAYLLTDWAQVPEIDVFLEGRGMALKMPKLAAALGPTLHRRKLELLKLMKPGMAYRPGDLCGFIGKDRSTVYRHLKDLIAAGLVERADGGFRITHMGLLFRD